MRCIIDANVWIDLYEGGLLAAARAGHGDHGDHGDGYQQRRR